MGFICRILGHRWGAWVHNNYLAPPGLRSTARYLRVRTCSRCKAFVHQERTFRKGATRGGRWGRRRSRPVHRPVEWVTVEEGR